MTERSETAAALSDGVAFRVGDASTPSYCYARRTSEPVDGVDLFVHSCALNETFRARVTANAKPESLHLDESYVECVWQMCSSPADTFGIVLDHTETGVFIKLIDDGTIFGTPIKATSEQASSILVEAFFTNLVRTAASETNYERERNAHVATKHELKNALLKNNERYTEAVNKMANRFVEITRARKAKLAELKEHASQVREELIALRSQEDIFNVRNAIGRMLREDDSGSRDGSEDEGEDAPPSSAMRTRSSTSQQPSSSDDVVETSPNSDRSQNDVDDSPMKRKRQDESDDDEDDHSASAIRLDVLYDDDDRPTPKRKRPRTARRSQSTVVTDTQASNGVQVSEETPAETPVAAARYVVREILSGQDPTKTRHGVFDAITNELVAKFKSKTKALKDAKKRSST